MKHFCIALLLAVPGQVLAHPATIEGAEARAGASGWTFSVTLRHAETGWDDYADGWRVVTPDGTVAGTRILAHPHENEQPFTRSLSGVALPDGTTYVTIESRTKVDGWSGDTFRLELPTE